MVLAYHHLSLSLSLSQTKTPIIISEMSPISSSSLFLISLLLITNIFSLSSVAEQNPIKITDGFLIDLIHVDSHTNFTALERLQRAIKRSMHRLARLQAKTTTSLISESIIQSPVHAGDGEFLMTLSIGSPPSSFSAIVDTGSDLIWTQCQPCTQCYDQPTPIFNPSKSSSFKKIPCSSNLCKALPSFTCNPDCEYVYTYGDDSFTHGILALETFILGKTRVPKIGFGCGEDNDGVGMHGGAGLVGLGRGPLSLISQLGWTRFSYCLTPIDDTKTSKLLFGTSKDLNFSRSLSLSSTPLIKNRLADPSFYYISLEGITVGSKLLSIPKSTFALKKDGSGGLIIDSGTTITYLEMAGYKQLKKAFAAQVKLPSVNGSGIGLDLCFTSSSSQSNIKLPELIYHFKKADLHLSSQNYLIEDESSGLSCLAIMGTMGLSILGNIQQQNLQIVYDLGKEELSFAHAQCDQM